MKKQAGKKKVGSSFITDVYINDDIFLPGCAFFFINHKLGGKKHAVYILAYSTCLGFSLMTHYAIMQITEMANLLLNHP